MLLYRLRNPTVRQAGDLGRLLESMPVQRQEKPGVPAPTVRQREHIRLCCTFCLLQALERLGEPPHWEGDLLCSVHRFKCQAHLETPSQTCPE